VDRDVYRKVIKVYTKRYCYGYIRESGIKLEFILQTATSRVFGGP